MDGTVKTDKVREEGADNQARETIKNVNVDSSGRLEVEDWVQLHSLLRAGKSQPVYVLIPSSTSPYLPLSSSRICLSPSLTLPSSHRRRKRVVGSVLISGWRPTKVESQ